MRTIKREIVGGFIFSKDEKILLGHAGVFSGEYCVPGGGIDEGETEVEALKREMFEETGIDLTGVDIVKIEGSNSGASEKTLRDSGERVLVEMTFYDYLVKLNQDSEEVKLALDDDFTNARWFSKDELRSIEIAKGTTKRLVQLDFISL